ncbi:hypothetical protein [Caldivirga sp.]|uniref:hypothetical protein n=1 Tax=Caldivirga sp. TaxID=2080243 RepID=UPI0025BA45E9|nr:hypothetical protein [Caldivirga sp.]
MVGLCLLMRRARMLTQPGIYTPESATPNLAPELVLNNDDACITWVKTIKSETPIIEPTTPTINASVSYLVKFTMANHMHLY